MTISTTDWTLTNDRGLGLIGSTEHPGDDAGGDEGGDPIACVVLLHGWKGYKDYGFVPVLSRALAERGIVVHRFNGSCSGMTNDVTTFARPELFALDTWNRQVEDVRCVVDAIGRGAIAGAGLPLFLCGHSRGGGTVLLTAGRDPGLGLQGIITINAVDDCDRMDAPSRASLLEEGFITTTSARTGQTLRVELPWLQEQIDDPAGHDVLALCGRIGCAALVMHGEKDQAVDPSAGYAIAGALGTEVHVIKGADHVLNMANPAPVDVVISPQLREVIGLISSFVDTNRSQTPI